MRFARIMPPWLWVLLVILYFISPVDFIPDALGLPGRLDDFLVALAGIYFMYSNSQKKRVASADPGRREKGERVHEDAGQRDGGSSGESQAGAGKASPDPYEVLGVSRGTPMTEIRRAYRERLLQYHPDRVEHLGAEFRELAEVRTRELNRAFESIEKDRAGKA